MGLSGGKSTWLAIVAMLTKIAWAPTSLQIRAASWLRRCVHFTKPWTFVSKTFRALWDIFDKIVRSTLCAFMLSLASPSSWWTVAPFRCRVLILLARKYFWMSPLGSLFHARNQDARVINISRSPHGGKIAKTYLCSLSCESNGQKVAKRIAKLLNKFLSSKI